MNLNDYITRESIYSEFANIVKFILEAAISHSKQQDIIISVPQSIQARAKAKKSLEGKLKDRLLLESECIEKEIKDLAGVRLIFYTNKDVDNFTDSQLIPNNFTVDWSETKIHHNTDKDSESRYQAIHYTVSLQPERLALSEYAKFQDMRCEIQIQTILNHAWAEINHDIVYKGKGSKGFGSDNLTRIENRMKKIMDNYLISAGHEFNKVQYDHERLMQGKELFDRGMLESLANCKDNNERHDILSSISEYVREYDDIVGIYKEICSSLVNAMNESHNSETKPIETPFGNYEGKSHYDIAKIVIEILNDLRYVDIKETFDAVIKIYLREKDARIHELIFSTINKLAQYNIEICQKYSYGAQCALTEIVEQLSNEEKKSISPIMIAIWEAFLGSDLQGAYLSSYNQFTISTGAVRADINLATIREKAINGLIELFDRATSDNKKFRIFHALEVGMRTPIYCTNELYKLIFQNTIHIVSALNERMAKQNYELLTHIEDSFFLKYRIVKQIADSQVDKLGCKDVAKNLVDEILKFRDYINHDDLYIKYKTLVGFKSIFPPHWIDDSFDYRKVTEYRNQKITEYVNSIDESNQDYWYNLIEICAATDSDDLATFPVFCEFLKEIAKNKPYIAIKFINSPDSNILKFLVPLFNGLSESDLSKEYSTIIDEYLSKNDYLNQLARHFRFIKNTQPEHIKKLLDAAINFGENIAVMECIILAIEQYNTKNLFLISDIFLPAIKYLIDKKDARWIRNAWYLQEGKDFFNNLSIENANLVIDSLLPLPRIDHESEAILTHIANNNPELVWKFLEQRLYIERTESENYYQAIPYSLNGLENPLQKNINLAISTVRSWFPIESSLFRFKGGRLLSIVFPTFPQGFEQNQSNLIPNATDDDIGFIIAILENYKGKSAIYGILKQLIDYLPENDKRLNAISICIESTGVISGEFGFVEAYSEKKNAINEWLSDNRIKVKQFAERFIKRIEQRIASEKRTAEQRVAQEQLSFED